MKNIDQLAEFLVEGSIWQSKRGKTYTVVAVSNLYVPKEKQDVLEPTVTFINADGVMFSLSIDRFLRMYSFVEVNDKMANCVENVYKCNAGELIDENELEPESFIDELESEQVKAEKRDLAMEAAYKMAETDSNKNLAITWVLTNNDIDYSDPDFYDYIKANYPDAIDD